MTCCKSTSTGVGIPTTAPSNNDPDIYIEQPSGQIWVWNGTSWVKPPVGSVSYNSTTRVLTVGSSSVTLPIASKTEYGVVKLADPATDPNNPIEANSDGTLTIDCAKLITHCNLPTKAYVDSKVANAIDAIPEPEQLTGAQVVAMLAAMSNEQLAGLACKLKSNDAGNLLSCRADGLYYGITPPADVVNQYVDPVNGSDTNSGTRVSPLRTIMRAIDRLPSGTRGTIHLVDNATHYFPSSQRKYLDKDIYMYPYGAATDVAQATWDAPLSSWYWLGWKNSPKATIQFIYDDPRGVAEPGKMLGMCINVNQGHFLHFNGINCITPAQDNVTAVWYWKASISGNGKIVMTDCGAITPQWPLFSSSPLYSPTVSLEVVDHVGAGYVFELTSGGRMTVDVVIRQEGYTNPQGLLYNNGSSHTYYASKVHGRMTAVPVSPNFNANF